MKRASAVVLLLLVQATLLAQSRHQNIRQVTLFDGTKVTLIAGRETEPGITPYYYLPVNLRFSEQNGIPEFSFITYTKDNNAEIEGGYMHFLLTWGLTTNQEKELEDIIATDTTEVAYLKGAVMLTTVDTGDSIPEFISESALGRMLKKTVSAAGKTPLFPGHKTAIAFDFSAEEAIKMCNALKNPEELKRVQICLPFAFDSIQINDLRNNQLIKKYRLQTNFRELIKGFNPVLKCDSQ